MKVQKAIDGIEDISNHIRADYALEIGNYTHVIASHIKMLEVDNKRLRSRARSKKDKVKNRDKEIERYREAIELAMDYMQDGRSHKSNKLYNHLLDVLKGDNK